MSSTKTSNYSTGGIGYPILGINIENPATSAIGSTMQVRFDLIETQNITLVDTVVDITDVRTW